ncbi:hypothetical protein IV60_GL000098 [Lancefieldella rimae]|uniref:Uncharacterized protein n=2 Tax=Lancefieldella rimae TaxID=1383 RepID=B9CL37_LANR4|nr:hypothetical protein ATORI0001_0751 [Lancefieldella rimae ATCC 49626]KRO02928.1 hypothetical protein IV60_GL000098 [Lancefieldella rimae]
MDFPIADLERSKALLSPAILAKYPSKRVNLIPSHERRRGHCAPTHANPNRGGIVF